MRQVFLPSIVLWLAACPTVDLGETPVTPPLCIPDLQTFTDTIWPVAVAPPETEKSCIGRSGCHAQANGSSALRLIPNPASTTDYQTNLNVIARYLNCATPANSQFITKPEEGIDSHLGGDLWVCDATCEPITTVEAWIAAR